jgi:hypothetical protein
MIASIIARARVLHAALLVAAIAIAACGDPPNTQYLPIGQRCGEDGECGTPPYRCEMGSSYPGGYCERSCATDGDCPLDAICAAGRCRRKCLAPAECRQIEGYTCRPTGATSPFCDLPVSGG